MSFLPTIPQATDQLSISQANLLNNFVILGAIAGNSNASSASINTSGTNSGFNWIYLPNNSATPPTGSSFPSGQVALYGSANGTTGHNELYINKTIAGPTIVQIPATAYFANSTSGWTYLPSGVLMIWGFGTIVSGGTLTVNYSSVTGFPGFSTGATPTVTRYRASVPPADAFVVVSAYSTSSFTVQSSTGNNSVSFLWTAIGI